MVLKKLFNRILEWVAFPFSRRSSQPRDRTQVSHIAPPSNFLQHQQSVLQFNSVLTLITGQRPHQSPQVKGLVSQDCTLHSPTYPHSLLKPVTSPGWHLCFWSTGYRWGFK